MIVSLMIARPLEYPKSLNSTVVPLFTQLFYLVSYDVPPQKLYLKVPCYCYGKSSTMLSTEFAYTTFVVMYCTSYPFHVNLSMVR